MIQRPVGALLPLNSFVMTLCHLMPGCTYNPRPCVTACGVLGSFYLFSDRFRGGLRCVVPPRLRRRLSPYKAYSGSDIVFFLPAQVRHNQSNFFIREPRRERFLDGRELAESEFPAGIHDFILFFLIYPLRLEFQFSTFDEVRDQTYDCRSLPAADCGDLIESAPFRKQSHRFV